MFAEAKRPNDIPLRTADQILHRNKQRILTSHSIPNKDVSLPCPFVFVECKNYTGEVANPELDQLGGRFSNRRGRVGILACRSLDDKKTFMKRCADTLNDDRGLIIPICDEDLKMALSLFPESGVDAVEQIFQKKYEEIVFMK